MLCWEGRYYVEGRKTLGCWGKEDIKGWKEDSRKNRLPSRKKKYRWATRADASCAPGETGACTPVGDIDEHADEMLVSAATPLRAPAVLTGVPPDPPFLLPFCLPTARVGGCDIFFEVTFPPFFHRRLLPRNFWHPPPLSPFYIFVSAPSKSSKLSKLKKLHKILCDRDKAVGKGRLLHRDFFPEVWKWF